MAHILTCETPRVFAFALGGASLDRLAEVCEAYALYYAERGMVPEAAYVALCERITAAKVNIEENKNRIAELKAEGNVSDADIPHVETDVPPEEPVDGGCGCCDHEVAPEEVFSDDDKPQE